MKVGKGVGCMRKVDRCAVTNVTGYEDSLLVLLLLEDPEAPVNLACR